MHPDLEKLVLLQTHDLEAHRLRDEIAALPRHIATLESQRKSAEDHRASLAASLAKEEVLRRSQESDIATLRTKIERVRRQMDLATTTAQVTAFEHELAFSHGEITKLEDAELESLERTESLEAEKAHAEETLANAIATLERERTRAASTIETDRQALAAVEQAREALRPQIGEDLRDRYDRIAHAKGTAIAEALNQKCVACQMMLRPQKWNDLRDRADHETIFTCDTCGRLLYYNPANDAPQRKPAASESIAATSVRSSI